MRTILSSTFIFLVSFQVLAADFSISEDSAKKIDLAMTKATQQAGPGRKIAVFEVDNLLLQGSFQEGFLAWMIRNNKILKPTNWTFASRWLTDAAIDILDDRCSLNSTAALTLLTSANPICAQTIWWIYSQAQIPGHGELKVWKRADADSTEKYKTAWATQLQAGYTAKEMRDFARAALKEARSFSPSKVLKMGEAEVRPALRYTPALSSLIRRLESKGFEVWLTGAMSQPAIEAVAEDLKISKERSIGIRARQDNKQRLLSRFENCTSERDPTLNLAQGRRCWIQKMIFLEKTRSRMMDTPAPIDLYFGTATTSDILAKDARFLKAQVDLKTGNLKID